MEDLALYNFTVKSSIQDYSVFFTDDAAKELQSTYKPGDIVVIDQVVQQAYHQLLDGDVIPQDKVIAIEATERTKSYQGVEPIIDQLILGGFRKNHRLIAIGGGITQDVVAFMASILYRGVQWIFFPTTLLAQGDSCIGSKTSINFNHYKNQVGGFYPPQQIFIDPQFLRTLTLAELKSGLGEMTHYYVVAGQEDFDRFKRDYPAALQDFNVINGLTKRSLEIKKSYVEIDEYDRKERQVFNYGHSFGHAIESFYKYAVPHGVAVSFGMDMSNFVSMKKGYIQESDFIHMRELFSQIWSEFSIADLDIDVLIDTLKKDKKNVDNQLGLILNKGAGKVFKDLTDPDETFRSWMIEYIKTYHKTN